MSDSGPETSPDSENPPDCRRSAWWRYLLVLCVIVVVLIGMSRWWLPLWVGSVVDRAAARRGIHLEAFQIDVAPSGGLLREVRGRGPATDFSIERVVATWDAAGAIEGRVDEVSLEGAEAWIDVARLWPARQRAELPQGVDLQPGADSAADGRDVLLPPSRPAPAPVQQTGIRVVEPEVQWWEDLPIGGFFVPSGRITAEYGEAKLSLTAQAAYTMVDFRREAWVQLEGAGLDLRLNARQVVPGDGWTAQGKLAWAEPVRVISGFFPPTHAAHPREWEIAGIRPLALSEVRAEAVARGEGSNWEELGLLLEGGSAVLGWAEQGRAELSEWIVALRGFPSELEVNAGLAVDSLRQGHWSAESFQLTVERDPLGDLRVETPLLRWHHAAGFSGEVTGRLFAASPPGGGHSAEAQLAFTELVTPFFALRPFRWFFNIRPGKLEGRVSTLELLSNPSWGFSETQVEADWSGDGREWNAKFATALEFSPEARSIARIDGEVRSQGHASVATAGTVRVPEGPAVARWEGRVGAENGTGVSFSETWQLAEMMPWLQSVWPMFAGWRADGALDWRVSVEGRDVTDFSGRVSASLRDVSVSDSDDQWAATGVSGRVDLVADPFPYAVGVQHLELGALQLGKLFVTNADVLFSWPTLNVLRVEKFTGVWLGGNVRLEPFSFDPSAPAGSITFSFEGVDPAQAREIFPSIPESEEGQLRGNGELSYHSGEWKVGPLSLSLEQNGEEVWRGHVEAPAAVLEDSGDPKTAQ